jgi:hypothetical protein
MDKNLLEILKFAIPALIAVVGWLIGHYFSSKRDKSGKKRELTLKHLINTYSVLTNEISHRKAKPESELKLEEIITEIQLFGSSEQVSMAKQLAIEVAAKKEFELDPLINSLRNDLRKQLELAPIKGNVTWLRFNS